MTAVVAVPDAALSSEDAERALIGELLMDPAKVRDAAGIVGPGDFTNPRFGAVFGLVAALVTAGGELSALTVMEEVRRRRARDGQNMWPAPSDLVDLVGAGTGLIREAAQLVRRTALRRDAVGILRQAAVNIATAEDPGAVTVAAVERLTQLQDGTRAATDEASVRAEVLRQRLVNADQLRTLPDPVPIVAGMSEAGATLMADSLAWLYGRPGHAKSFVAVELACCIATGHTWHGREVRQGAVLYVLAEGVAGMASRVEAWESWYRTKIPGDQLQFLPVAVQLGQPVDVAAVRMLAAEMRPTLIVIDTQARATVGLEENSAKDAGLVVAALDSIRDACGACVLTVHHIGRSGDTPRGSTAIDGAAETLIRVEKDGGFVRLDMVKQKSAPEDPPLALHLMESCDSVILDCHGAPNEDQKLTPAEVAILDALGSHGGSRGMTATPLKEASDVRERTFYRAVKSLREKGMLRRDDSGAHPLYLLPDAGQGQLLP